MYAYGLGQCMYDGHRTQFMLSHAPTVCRREDLKCLANSVTVELERPLERWTHLYLNNIVAHYIYS